jgi:hypothetical protein
VGFSHFTLENFCIFVWFFRLENLDLLFDSLQIVEKCVRKILFWPIFAIFQWFFAFSTNLEVLHEIFQFTLVQLGHGPRIFLFYHLLLYSCQLGTETHFIFLKAYQTIISCPGKYPCFAEWTRNFLQASFPRGILCFRVTHLDHAVKLLHLISRISII